MRSKRLVIAIPLALVFVIGGGAALWAAHQPIPRDCADIRGTAVYTKPKQASDTLGNPTWTTPGSLEFTMTLAAATCADVQYGVVVLGNDPLADPENPKAPTVLASSSVPGDNILNELKFHLEINETPTQEKVCVYAFTSGTTGTSSTGKSGAAFDGTAAATILDRAPDGPLHGDSDQSAYCFLVPAAGARTYN